MTTILVRAGEQSQTLFFDPARVDRLADGSVAALALSGAPDGNHVAAALDLLSAYAASQPGEDASAAQELVAAVCLWTVKQGMPGDEFGRAKLQSRQSGADTTVFL